VPEPRETMLLGLTTLFEAYSPSKIAVFKAALIPKDVLYDMFGDLKKIFNNVEYSDVVLSAKDEPDQVIHCLKLVTMAIRVFNRIRYWQIVFNFFQRCNKRF
jgi:hypothetical protein